MNIATGEGQGFAVHIDMELTPELLKEGIARDVVRRIQSLRKELDLQYDQSIDMGFDGDPEIVQAIEEHSEYIAKETLAAGMQKGELPMLWECLIALCGIMIMR